ncbi:MAG: aminodeoxychorismate synthase component I [Gammaproteobacteria bacterium]|nr:aminodeoxychorismate synthase component I [Gammaproteobacteria bacterium]
MGSHDLVELPYPEDSARLFEHLLHLPWPVFLDSGHPHYPAARYDILTALPATTLITNGPITRIQSRGGTRWSFDDPFLLLKQQLSDPPIAPTALPFSGGAIGYFAYDLCRRLEQLPEKAKVDLNLPDMAIGLYDWALIVDHKEQQAWLTGHCPDKVLVALRRVPEDVPKGISVHSKMLTNMDWEPYLRAFKRIKHYIREGDCYQVNLARRFSADIDGHPWAIYHQLRKLSPAPFGAYLDTPYGTILSLSPERFLQLRDGLVETRPIKGTRPCGATPEDDRLLVEELRQSDKDRAENIMIVDLLRNDLGKSCATGSVAVPRLLELESFSHVHHLVSTVTGRLRENLHATDLLRGCFPGGSITGAPKVRSMEIIEELEPHRRGVYCGAIGYLGYEGNMDTNIAIRTLVYRGGTAYFWAGGGIVADSDPEAEYREILDKARAVFTTLSPPPVSAGTGQRTSDR